MTNKILATDFLPRASIQQFTKANILSIIAEATSFNKENSRSNI